MKYKYQCECMDDNCRTVIVGPDHRLDGIRCLRCGGPVNVKPFETRVVKTAINKPLLTIELENETAVPKVFYKGEEINLKREIFFHWETDTSIPGGLSYSIEHAEMEGNYPTVNKIERRLKGHA